MVHSDLEVSTNLQVRASAALVHTVLSPHTCNAYSVVMCMYHVLWVMHLCECKHVQCNLHMQHEALYICTSQYKAFYVV